ncbi:hypothetical protein EIP86_007761, partial [Pleurotus ostreatoroseus]
MSTTPSNTSIPSYAEIRERTLRVFERRACLWQCQVTQAILKKQKDVVAVAPTGAGKTLSFWMPLLFRPTGKVVVITPLNILGGQNERSLARLGIKAISIDSKTATPSNIQAIEEGKFRVVIVNPEVALKKKGPFERLWKSTVFTSDLVSIVWDEAHCVSAWGSFRPEYANAGWLRNIIPRHIPYLIPSATLPPHVRRDVMDILQVQHEHTEYILRSNDRPNIHITVRKIRYPLVSFKDLDFLIPDGWDPGKGGKLPKFLVFFDRKADAIAAADHLRSRLPVEYRDRI